MARRLRNVFVVVLWFAANIGVVFLNKLLLTNYQFRYPVFLTGCHVRLDIAGGLACGNR